MARRLRSFAAFTSPEEDDGCQRVARDARRLRLSVLAVMEAGASTGELGELRWTSVATDEAESGPEIVKIKRFDMLPMFEEDAITQMEELGHAFFVFLDAETDAVAVVYRRKDGNYGLIAPVLQRRRR